MFFVVLILLGFVGTVSLLWAFLAPTGEEAQRRDVPSKTMAIFAMIIVALLQIGWLGVNSFHQVDAKQVAVIREFGKITGQIGEGPNFTVPWAKVESWSIANQTVVPRTQCSNGLPNCMDAGSVDVQSVYVQGELNIAVSPSDVQNLSRRVGPNYVQDIVLGRMDQVVKQIISQYQAENILAARPEIRLKIQQDLTAELEPFSITVTNFQLRNIAFTPEFDTRIEEKVAAEVQAATERNRVEIAIAQAEQAEEQARGLANAEIARAEGQKQARILIAEGEAEANRLLAESLTPEVIQWQAINSLYDNIQFGLLPGDIPLLLDPFTLLDGGSTE